MQLLARPLPRSMYRILSSLHPGTAATAPLQSLCSILARPQQVARLQEEGLLREVPRGVQSPSSKPAATPLPRLTSGGLCAVSLGSRATTNTCWQSRDTAWPSLSDEPSRIGNLVSTAIESDGLGQDPTTPQSGTSPAALSARGYAPCRCQCARSSSWAARAAPAPHRLYGEDYFMDALVVAPEPNEAAQSPPGPLHLETQRAVGAAFPLASQ